MITARRPGDHRAIAGRMGMQAFGDPLLGAGVERDAAEIVGDQGLMQLTQLETRQVEEDDEKWFEVGFTVPFKLNGNARDGWFDRYGVRLALQRSETLLSWHLGEFTDCANSPTKNLDGSYTYWCRSIYPVDSLIKTGNIYVQSPGDYGQPDSRNNPFTGITINGVVQSLANAPYTMPGDAAQLQTDLRALGWTGATVTASAATVWRIDIPNVDFDAWDLATWVHWTGYLIPDMYGALTILIDRWGFTGEFINEAGVRTSNHKQFARLKAYL